jgi:hypothetical protein
MFAAGLKGPLIISLIVMCWMTWWTVLGRHVRPRSLPRVDARLRCRLPLHGVRSGARCDGSGQRGEGP